MLPRETFSRSGSRPVIVPEAARALAALDETEMARLGADELVREALVMRSP